jgi:hypothetical protein
LTVSKEPEQRRRLTTAYTRQAVEWIAVVGFAGVVTCILGVGAAMVYWAWTA